MFSIFRVRACTLHMRVEKNNITSCTHAPTFTFHPLPIHCVKSGRIWSYSGQDFPTFGLNTEGYGLSIRIRSECGKMLTRITPNTGTFYAVNWYKKLHLRRCSSPKPATDFSRKFSKATLMFYCSSSDSQTKTCSDSSMKVKFRFNLLVNVRDFLC